MNALGRRFGFTIIELLATIVTVSVLAGISLPMTELAVQRNKEQELRRLLRKAGESGYPRTLETLVDGAADVKIQLALRSISSV